MKTKLFCKGKDVFNTFDMRLIDYEDSISWYRNKPWQQGAQS
jgi:hypothetical protein